MIKKDPTEYFLNREEMKMTYQEDKYFEEECEEYWHKVGRDLGRWWPTRQLAYNAMRQACFALEENETKTNRLWWAVGIEAVAIIVLFILLLA